MARLKRGQLVFHMTAWQVMLAGIVNTEGHRRMTRVADACNEEAGLGDDGYKVGVEGNPSKTLKEDDFRATVITSTTAAIHDNAVNNRLVQNFHLAGGE
jgi:hypothetical protein